jgi:small subunit ribosomal protein S4
MKIITDSLTVLNNSKYTWIECDNASLSGKLMYVPDREEIPENIKEQLIVELYSK